MDQVTPGNLITDIWAEVRPWITTLSADFVILLAIIAFFVAGQILIYISSAILNGIGYIEPLKYIVTIETLFKTATILNVIIYIIIQLIRKLRPLKPVYNLLCKLLKDLRT